MINLLLIFMTALPFAHAKTVRYELKIENRPVNLSGKKTVDFSLTVNGGIPAPTLEFTEGDDAEITVVNGLANEEVSIHWHGLLIPPEMDGVAYLNTPPIFPGQSFTFKFPIRQQGTYWYHSHTMVQEQKGVYGAFIIHPKEKPSLYDRDVVAVISDWSDEDADQIMRNLRKDGDYYLYKKNSMRSYAGAFMAGKLKNHLANEWERMGGMDLSDVGYDAFLINGKREWKIGGKPGERLRIRLINASSSTYFSVGFGQAPVRVLSADGRDLSPTRANELLMAMAETYDVLVTVPENKSVEVRATPQDVSGSTSAWIGDGEKLYAPTKTVPDPYARMDHSAHQGHQEHHEHHHGPVIIETLTVDELRAPASTAFPSDKKVHEVRLVLDGDMERYVWYINGKALYQDRFLDIEEGQVIRYTFENKTMMHHPMHLHGHFFRVLNAGGDLSPLKHTVDVPPHSSRTIEFFANEPGQWMLHCHNLYHMKSGMARIVRYSSFVPKPEIAEHAQHDPHLHDHTYYTGLAEISSNHAKFRLKASQTWNELELKAEGSNGAGKNFSFKEGEWDAEGDLFYKRWFNRYFHFILGGTSFEGRQTAVTGAGYLLPLLIESRALINHDGRLRLDLEKRFQWTKSIFSDLEYNWRPDQGGHEHEVEFSLMYGPSWHWSAGLMLTNEVLGAGFEARF